VLDEVLLGMWEEDADVAGEVLNGLSLLAMKDAHPMSLSGGEKQRVAIATAIASGREIIVFDEPTSGLDYKHMRRVADNIRRLNEAGKTILVITHDPELILSCCTHAMRMEKGESAGVFALDASGLNEMLSFFMKEVQKDDVRRYLTEEGEAI
jgi:energy-coupling factor transport system ATP-binding protein